MLHAIIIQGVWLQGILFVFIGNEAGYFTLEKLKL